MKKIIIGIAVLSVAILTLGVAGFAFAQNQTPPTPDYPEGPGMMGGHGRGMMRW